MKTALVTGASGFIGTRLCKELLKLGWRVKGTSLHGIVPDGVEPYRLDLTARQLPVDLCEEVDVVFHLAGKAHVTAAGWQDEEEYLLINTAGTRKLLEAAKQAGVKRFIYFSSVKAAGETAKECCLGEDEQPAPRGPYAISKLLSERLVLDGEYVSEPIVIRPTMVYGETLRGNLPSMIRAIAAHRFPPIPEFGNHRSMVHIADLIDASILAATSDNAVGQTFVVSDGRVYSTRDIYCGILKAFGMPIPPWRIPSSLFYLFARVGDFAHYLFGRRVLFDSTVLERISGSAWYCSDRIVRELGFSPTRNLHDALPDIVRFVMTKQ